MNYPRQATGCHAAVFSGLVTVLLSCFIFLMLIDAVRETIKKHSLLSPGDRVVVAVSGGPDSVCLLSVLRELSRELDLTLQVAHVDHMFRGKESADDARFVADLANKLGLPSSIGQFDVPRYCRERGCSSQEGARKVRYGFLQQVAHDTGASRIATGHTADDQAETLLMRLIRGAGVAGLSGIPPVRDNVVRPLIEITRTQVLDYLRQQDLAYRVDPSNDQPVYTRNRIRLEVLPVLKRLNPRIVETLALEAALLRDEDEAVEEHLRAIAEHAVARNDDVLALKREAFESLPAAFRRRLFRIVVNMTEADASSLSLGQVDDALAFLMTARTGRSLHLPRGLTVTREYDRFVFSTHQDPAAFAHDLPVPGTLRAPEIGREISTEVVLPGDPGPERSNYRWQASFDYDKIRPFLTIRSRRPGDWFRPAGMAGKSKKLQDFFVDEKVPLRKRGSIPLLCSGEDILWVVGLRTDERFLPGPETKKIVIVTVR
ncbi:MAG: tRNA lysidine(34) synthetase TilS [Nitrospirota bacterium]|nr:tRNA lysidine(34) synthetase TilS [Nitrospirota bacterium]